MLAEMILGGLGAQIVELKLDEARRDRLEELRWKTQRVSLTKQLTPHPIG
jgi:hypothetical protein